MMSTRIFLHKHSIVYAMFVTDYTYGCRPFRQGPPPEQVTKFTGGCAATGCEAKWIISRGVLGRGGCQGCCSQQGLNPNRPSQALNQKTFGPKRLRRSDPAALYCFLLQSSATAVRCFTPATVVLNICFSPTDAPLSQMRIIEMIVCIEDQKMSS